MLAPVSRTNCTYCASANSIRSRVSAGERIPPTISKRSISCLNSALCAAWRAAAARRSTISAGSRGGPRTKCAVMIGAADTPASDSVGTVGNAAMRSDMLQPSITSRPDLTCGALAPTGSTAAWMRPSSRSGSSWGAPL